MNTKERLLAAADHIERHGLVPGMLFEKADDPNCKTCAIGALLITDPLLIKQFVSAEDSQVLDLPGIAEPVKRLARYIQSVGEMGEEGPVPRWQIYNWSDKNWQNPGHVVAAMRAAANFGEEA